MLQLLVLCLFPGLFGSTGKIYLFICSYALQKPFFANSMGYTPNLFYQVVM